MRFVLLFCIGFIFFGQLANGARQLGMRVIPIESEAIRMSRKKLVEAQTFYDAKAANFNQEIFIKYRSDLLLKLHAFRPNPYSPPGLPEYNDAIQKELARIQKIGDYLDSIAWSLARYRADFRTLAVDGFDNDAVEIIRAQVPALVFVGFGHLKGLSALSDFRLVDATVTNFSVLVGDNSTLWSHPLVNQPSFDLSQDLRIEIYQSLSSQILTLSSKSLSGEEIGQIISRIIADSPALVPHLDRRSRNTEIDLVLTPAEISNMSADTAKEQLTQIILQYL